MLSARPRPDTVALLIAVMRKRADKSRVRISDKTFRRISRRQTIRAAFVAAVSESLEDYDVMMVELQRGGYALIAIDALEGAPPILAKDFIANECKQSATGGLDENALLTELGYEIDGDEE